MTRRTLRPRPFETKKRLTIVHDASGLELSDSTVARSIANRNSELEKSNDKVVTIAKEGEEVVPVPGFRQATHYEQLYPNDFKQTDDMNAEYLTSGKNLLPLESQCVEYAADSEDEDWLGTNMNTDGQDRLSMPNFEKLIWKLEMANYMIVQHTLRKAGASMMERKSKGSSAFVQHLTKAAAVKLLVKHEGSDRSVIERVYEYWTQKRRARREPLLRTLQPKTAATDKDPDHTFREREKIKRPNTRRRRHVNKGDNVDEKFQEIRDEMGHASNIFRSIINREATKAHVVNVYTGQRRLLFDRLAQQGGERSSQAVEIRKEHSKREHRLKKDDAEYRSKICRFLLQNVFHGNLRNMFMAPRGAEGDAGCDVAVSRRLKKAQKRQQKVISFLVRDRNWHKWHDKSWLQKMFLLLQKRQVANGMTKHINQRRIWKKWEAFVKHTRDKRVRRYSEHQTQKRKNSPGKTYKSPKTPRAMARSGLDPRSESMTSPDTPTKNTPRSGMGMMLERGVPKEEPMLRDPIAAETTAESTLSWALRQHIAPPVVPNISKTIRIPSSIVVPENGFSCLPPRLKEMYTEAEKDATQTPADILNKLQAMKVRRSRIQQLVNKDHLERSAAVVQFNQERKEATEASRQKAHIRRLRKKIFSAPCKPKDSSRPDQIQWNATTPINATPDVSANHYSLQRRAILKRLKEQIQASVDNTSQEHRRLVESFHQLKNSKKPDVAFLERLIQDLGHSYTAGNGEAALNELKKPTNGALHQLAPSRVTLSEREVDSRPNEISRSSKKISLTKRRNRRLTLEIHFRNEERLLELEPGADIQLIPFAKDSQMLDKAELEKCLQVMSPSPAPKTEQYKREVKEEPPTPMDLETESASNWNQLCARNGPVAHVPVHSHRMFQAQSAPLLVSDDDCYASVDGNKCTKKISIGLNSSRRLLQGKAVSMAAVKKRRRLRKQLLKPYLSGNEARRCLPKTKLRKLTALCNVRMQVPSRPMRKPLFSHVFRLNRPIQPEKIHINWSLPPSVPPQLVQSGVARIGRGNRVWIDRVDPVSQRRLIDNQREATGQAVLPILRRVLEADEMKRRILTQQIEQQNQLYKLHEQRKAEKANQIRGIAARLLNRQHNLLPHCIVQPETEKQDNREQRRRRKSNFVDTHKDAERLYGIASEMGLQLPLDRLYSATAIASEAFKKTFGEDGMEAVPIKKEEDDRREKSY